MKAVRLHGIGDLRLSDEAMPTAGPGECLVRVTAVGVCGSDVHWFSEGAIGDAALARPLILGHEFAGITDAGERVAVDPAIPCGECELCQAGHPNLCTDLHFMGHDKDDGALREYIAVPRRCLYPLPDALSEADGAMLEPLGVALHALDLGHVKPGMSVGVLGCGSIGLLLVQLARVAGATTIIATDPLMHRLEAARRFGATHVIQAIDGNEAGSVWQAADQRGVDVAFEAAGANSAVDVAIAAARPGAQVVLVGIPSDDTTTFTASVARRKGLTLRLVRRMKHTYPRAIRLVERGMVDVRSLVTHRFPLVRAADAFALAHRREGIKVVVEV